MSVLGDVGDERTNQSDGRDVTDWIVLGTTMKTVLLFPDLSVTMPHPRHILLVGTTVS